jgi:hypothetical protein
MRKPLLLQPECKGLGLATGAGAVPGGHQSSQLGPPEHRDQLLVRVLPPRRHAAPTPTQRPCLLAAPHAFCHLAANACCKLRRACRSSSGPRPSAHRQGPGQTRAHD